MVGLDLLEQLLNQGRIDRVTVYMWRAADEHPLRKYIRVYMVGRREAAWDGPDSPDAWKLIDAARAKP